MDFNWHDTTRRDLATQDSASLRLTRTSLTASSGTWTQSPFLSFGNEGFSTRDSASLPPFKGADFSFPFSSHGMRTRCVRPSCKNSDRTTVRRSLISIGSALRVIMCSATSSTSVPSVTLGTVSSVKVVGDLMRSRLVAISHLVAPWDSRQISQVLSSSQMAAIALACDIVKASWHSLSLHVWRPLQKSRDLT